MKREKWRKIILGLVIFLILSALLMNGRDYLFVAGGIEKNAVFNGVDFANYYTASRMMSEKGGGVYDKDALENYARSIGRVSVSAEMVNYPPCWYLFMTPLAKMDYGAAFGLWLKLNHLFILLSALLLVLIFFREADVKIKAVVFILLSLFSLLFAPTIDTLGLGQVNGLILFLISLSIFLYVDPKIKKLSFMAGIPLGLGIALKGLPAPAALYFLVKKDWKSLGATVLSYFVFSNLPVLFWGSNIMKEFGGARSRVFFLKGTILDSSAYGFWRFVFPTDNVSPYTFQFFLYGAGALVLTGISAWLLFRDKERLIKPEYGMALLIALVPLITPFSWSHHHILNLIPLTALFAWLWQREEADTGHKVVLGFAVAAAFITSTSDGSFIPFYLYSEAVKAGRPLPGLFGHPYIYLKAFFRDKRLLFISNLVQWALMAKVVGFEFNTEKK